ncbi:MAG: amidohydrolase [Lachnotalea sp.]
MTKKDLLNYIDKCKEELRVQGRILFATPEVGFCEEDTVEIITSFFDAYNIKYEKNISKTGIRVTLGSGDGYHIGVLADMDALIVQGSDGPMKIHSCGHSVQVTMLMALALVFRKSNFLEEVNGKITFLFTPAEEFICLEDRKQLIASGDIKYPSGKQDMISKGMFDDINCVLSAHINGEVGKVFDVNSTLAGFMRKQVVFHGKAAHSGAAPHLGLNALHGATLAISGLSFIKDQFPYEDGVRLYPIITKGGLSTNAIPDEAVIESDLRANDIETLLELEKRFDRCVTSCAEAVGLTCDILNTTGYMPLKQSEEINHVVYENMKLYCSENEIIHNVISGAAGDVGDIGYLIPTIQFGFSGMKGRIHSSEFQIVEEDFVYGDVIKVMAGTIYDLLKFPNYQVKNPSYKEQKEFYLKNWLHEL